MITLSASEARLRFLRLGELAAQGPILILAPTPFLVTQAGGAFPTLEPAPGGCRRHVDLDLLGRLELADIEFPPS